MDSKEVIRKRAIITEAQSGEVVDSTECIAVAEDMKEDVILSFYNVHYPDRKGRELKCTLCDI